ncbi:hypothetical protein ACWGDE_01610 [Streptomyces sp. NPDC054956]
MPDLYGSAEMSDDRRTAIAVWLMTNGVDPADVPIDSKIVVNEHTITLDVYVRSDVGSKIFDPQAQGPVTERRTVPCISQPPKSFPA